MRYVLAALVLVSCSPMRVPFDAHRDDAPPVPRDAPIDAGRPSGYVACDECAPSCASGAPECVPMTSGADCSACAAMCGGHGAPNTRLTVTCSGAAGATCVDSATTIVAEFCYRFLG